MPAPLPDASASSPSRTGFARGLRLGLPILLGYMPVGAAFGVLATASGFSLAQSVASSALVFAGAGQFIALDLLKGGAGLLTVLLATGVLNLRHVLFGATISPYLSETSAARLTGIGLTTTDETFGVNITDLRAGSATEMSLLGVGVIAWFGWALGTAMGAGAASLIGDPSRWGVDFAMPAMFTALLVAQITERRLIAVAAGSAALTLLVSLWLPGAWPLIVGSVGAAVVATAVRA